MVCWSWCEIDQTTIDTCIKLTTLQVESVICRNMKIKIPKKNAQFCWSENIVEENTGKMCKIALQKQSAECISMCGCRR